MVENLRQLTAHDSMTSSLVSEFGRLIMRQPHVLLVNALGFALALKLLHAILYRDNEYNNDHAALCSSEQRRALDYLREHTAERVQVSDLARRLGLSRAHFARRFRATFGLPPLQYALKMRVDRGLELLRSGECRVAEAAYAVGFYDQSHFDRHCRKFYGHSPTEMHRINDK
jgi:AraC family transcriptional regulator